MKIENNILYRGHEPLSIMLRPLSIYNDTTAELNMEQDQKLTDEIKALETFSYLKSVQKLLNVLECEVTPISQYPDLLEKVKSDLKEKDLPVEMLDYVYASNEDGENSIYMLPNKFFPIASILNLKNAKNSFLYTSVDSIAQRRWSMVDDYEQKAAELKECKDLDFVKKTLEPFQKKIDEFDAHNKETVKSLQKMEDKFNQFLVNIGLKDEFDILEASQKMEEEPVVKKRKKKA